MTIGATRRKRALWGWALKESLGGVEECAPTDADLLLRFIRRKDSPARSKQAGSVGG